MYCHIYLLESPNGLTQCFLGLHISVGEFEQICHYDLKIQFNIRQWGILAINCTSSDIDICNLTRSKHFGNFVKLNCVFKQKTNADNYSGLSYVL